RWEGLLHAAQSGDRTRVLDPDTTRLVDQWESTRPPDPHWEILRPNVFLTSGAATLNILDDNSLRAEGPRPETDTYTLLATPGHGAITGLRLEVLTDPAFPKNGPGRQDNGNFHLSELELRLVHPSGTQGERVSIASATAD